MPPSSRWLLLASAASLIGGVVWFVHLLRADARSAPVSVSLPTGETITFEYDSTGPHAFTESERRLIEDLATRSFPDVRRVLPSLPPTLNLRLKSTTSEKVVPETGESGTNLPPDIVFWSIDASHPGGVEAVVRAELRAALFHELAHIARASAAGFGGQLRYHLIQEGLATAIERDYAGGPVPLWGEYPPEVGQWARELLALPKETPRDAWFSKDEDGRRWLGSKVGTYLVDRAAKASGKTSPELIGIPTETLIEMAVGAGDGGE
ncbi:MAG TPA: DUF2268 domain-containing putative Zn-dependent protease [Polyangiaceae bacterium]|jgi:hypothetical protein